jgi:hypothetical protein
MTHLDPEMDTVSAKQVEMRIDTLEPSGIDDMDMASDP